MHTNFIYVVLYFGVYILNQRLALCGQQCRCLASNSSCWPSSVQWNNFNQSVGGCLLSPMPSAAVCNGITYNANLCNITKILWSDGFWRSNQAGAMQNYNWENTSCSITTNSTTCNQGAVPVMAVNATLPEQVQSTIRLASVNNIRLVIKSTGHDYLGRSAAAGSLLLWVHYMKNMTIINQYSWCGRENISNAARIGAGAQWAEVYSWLDGFNLTAIGGAAASVGAVGGYLQGGGHSPLSRWKGLAADQVLEYDVVLASGERQTVSPCQNASLFWALSGGGGGTYAVVLSAVIRTFPSPYIVAAAYGVTAPNQTRYATLIESFVRLLSTVADAGWSGYFQMTDLNLTGIFIVPNGNSNAVSTILNQFVANNSDLDFGGSTIFTLPSFFNFFTVALAPNNPTGFDVLLGSRLIPESIIRNSPSQVASVFVQAKGVSTMGSSLLGHLVAGGQVSNVSNFNNSVNPGWRSSLLHMVCAQPWLDTTSAANKNYVIQLLANRTAMLNTLSASTQGSCYLNEANPNELNWQETFFGSSAIYAQLKSIKNTFDPNGLFVCNNCVGSDDWTSDLNCPKILSSTTKVNYSLFILVIAIITTSF
ncbi:unnamed protein product [Rotaria magnacalcarata]|uniref:FAD-binding PCMH-type domain-containing protein n=1 Tax=Rotaria magnacalcarata TaxID=392030 RepID=A0A819ELJ5_9BILA|nr:unnamed protein product [Rotaria magnacalcarata]CAF3851446.1 unnamed protein product [Rotaria magnacalcarata]